MSSATIHRFMLVVTGAAEAPLRLTEHHAAPARAETALI
jgi:hypothetical protein